MSEYELVGTTIKALGENRIGGYLVRFGSAAEKDLQGEYFTPSTDFGLDWYPVRPALYHHGRNQNVKGTLIGTIDTLRVDDTGVWAEAELSKAHNYRKAVRDLIDRGALAWSSGSLPGVVRKAADGRIEAWPIVEGSLTPTPVEPRDTGIRHLSDAATVSAVYKALDLPTEPIGLLQEADELPAEESGADSKALPSGEVVDNATSDKKGPTIMEITREELEALVARAASEGAKAVVAALPAPEEKPAPVEQPSKTIPNPPAPGPRIEVTRATKYSHLSASALGFMAEILGNTKGYDLPIPLLRELADKSFKAVAKGELPYDAVKTLSEKGFDTFEKASEVLGTGNTGFGLEWAPDSWRAELWMKTRQENLIASNLPFVQMPTDPYELPFESTDPTVYHTAETINEAQLAYTSANPITISKIGSGKKQLATQKLALRFAWSVELTEDTVIPVIENYRRQAIRAMQNAIDNVIINGDTETGANTNVNLIDSTPTAGVKYLAINGFRKYALVTNSAQSSNGAGVATLSMLRATRFRLAGAYALQPRECMWVVDDSTYASLLNLPEFLTMDKAGPNATALTGQVGVIDGVPVVATAEMGLSNTAGKISNTGSNNTKGQAIIVFRPNWMVGHRREVRANVSFLPDFDAYQMVVTARMDMVSFDATSAAMNYNLTV